MPSASAALLDALVGAGVTHIFANWGSDHPGLIEALAEARATGRPAPEVLTCPNEMVAMSAAHGHAQISGRAQAVIVHVECGTASLGGAVHNAAKGRVPVLVIAGASPFTQEGELPGSRNEFIQWIQDVHDQRGLVRGYMRYDAEIRTGRNIGAMVSRAMQFAHSDPKGPAYLMVAREVLEESVPAAPYESWPPISPAALAPADVAALAAALRAARRPLAVTSYLGRNPAAVPALVRLCERLGMGLLESVPNVVNFPATHRLHQGNQWNQPRQNEALAAADLVLVIDSDIPWIPTVSRPAPGAAVFHIDVDPLKEDMPLWRMGAGRCFRADALTALEQLNAALDGPDADGAFWGRLHDAREARLAALEAEDGLTGETLTAALRRCIDDRTIVVSEGISNYHAICDHLRLDRPGALYTSGGGSLGWNGGAAIGAKLARPDATIMALTGDGSFMFSAPSSVHWMARQYRTPFLQVVYNNRGWKSPKLSALAVHPAGYASRANEIDVAFDPPPDYGGIAAAAGGALALVARTRDELDDALDRAMRAVRVEQRCAVVDAHLPRL